MSSPFSKLRQLQGGSTYRKLSDLAVGVYKIKGVKDVNTRYGNRVVINIELTDCWYYLPKKYGTPEAFALLNEAVATNESYLNLKSIKKSSNFVEYIMDIVHSNELSFDLVG